MLVSNKCGYRSLYRYVREHQSDIFLLDVTIPVEIIHIESEFDLCIEIGIENLKEAMDEFLKVNELVTVKIQNGEESLTNDARKLWILYEKLFEARLRPR